MNGEDPQESSPIRISLLVSKCFIIQRFQQITHLTKLTGTHNFKDIVELIADCDGK